MADVKMAPAVQTAVAGTAAVTIIPASGNPFGCRDLVSLIITTANAAACVITISDGTKTVLTLNYPNAASAPGTPLVIQFCDVPLQQTAGNLAWTITCSVNASGFNVNAQYAERY